MKSSLLNEEARRKDSESNTNKKALVAEGDMIRGRGRNRSPRTKISRGLGQGQGGRPICFYCGKPGHFQKNYRHFQKEKGGVNGVELKEKGGADSVQPKWILKSNNTSAIATSEEELVLINEQNIMNLVGDESTWVIDSGASFHLTPDQKCFSSYKAGDLGSVKMGNEGTC